MTIITVNVPWIHLFVLRTQFGRSAWWGILKCMRSTAWEKNKKGSCILCNVGNVGHLVGIGVNVGLPLFLLCVGRVLMISCAVISIAGSTVGSWAWHRSTGGFGKCCDFTEIQQSPKHRLRWVICQKLKYKKKNWKKEKRNIITNSTFLHYWVKCSVCCF